MYVSQSISRQYVLGKLAVVYFIARTWRESLGRCCRNWWYCGAREVSSVLVDTNLKSWLEFELLVIELVRYGMTSILKGDSSMQILLCLEVIRKWRGSKCGYSFSTCYVVRCTNVWHVLVADCWRGGTRWWVGWTPNFDPHQAFPSLPDIRESRNSRSAG